MDIPHLSLLHTCLNAYNNLSLAVVIWLNNHLVTQVTRPCCSSTDTYAHAAKSRPQGPHLMFLAADTDGQPVRLECLIQDGHGKIAPVFRLEGLDLNERRLAVSLSLGERAFETDGRV